MNEAAASMGLIKTIDQLENNINWLNTLSTNQLQEVYFSIVSRKLNLKVKQLLIAEISYLIQSRQFGGLDKVTQEKLRELYTYHPNHN